MKITFRLTSVGNNVNEFIITANPGDFIFRNITKEMLLAGHDIYVPETVTGGTLTVSEDLVCEGLNKNWRVDNTLYIVNVYGANTVSDVCNRVNGSEVLVYQYEKFSLGLIDGRKYYNSDGTVFIGTYNYYASTYSCKYGEIVDGVFVSTGNRAGCTPPDDPQ